ncbi:hypothetical protein CHUAL_006272 [Chamberlinius hualienensis]
MTHSIFQLKQSKPLERKKNIEFATKMTRSRQNSLGNYSQISDLERGTLEDKDEEKKPKESESISHKVNVNEILLLSAEKPPEKVKKENNLSLTNCSSQKKHLICMWFWIAVLLHVVIIIMFVLILHPKYNFKEFMS